MMKSVRYKITKNFSGSVRTLELFCVRYDFRTVNCLVILLLKNRSARNIISEKSGFVNFYFAEKGKHPFTASNPNEKIFLHFTHFDTYSDTAGGDDGGNTETCYKSDYVQIYETLRPGLDIPKYCGTKAPPLYISGGNTVRVLFDAEWGGQNVQRTGFFATYTTSGDNCGDNYWSKSGSFMSPRYAEGTYSYGFRFIFLR